MREALTFRLSPKATSDELHRQANAYQLIVAAVLRTRFCIPEKRSKLTGHRTLIVDINEANCQQTPMQGESGVENER